MYDFKKQEKYLYMPKAKPEIIDVPSMNYVAVRGKGDPNKENSTYKKAIAILYAISYTLKMSYKTDYKIPGFYEYVVPPLESLWWQDGKEDANHKDKASFHWISMIRLPNFITSEDLNWAIEVSSKKKKLDCSIAEFLTLNEGICLQMLHVGSFNTEQETIKIMNDFLKQNGYKNDFSENRRHHEIYLTDPRKILPEKWKTVIRHPIKKI